MPFLSRLALPPDVDCWCAGSRLTLFGIFVGHGTQPKLNLSLSNWLTFTRTNVRCSVSSEQQSASDSLPTSGPMTS